MGAAKQAREHDKRESELFEAYAKEQIAQFEAEGRPTVRVASSRSFDLIFPSLYFRVRYY